MKKERKGREKSLKGKCWLKRQNTTPRLSLKLGELGLGKVLVTCLVSFKGCFPSL